ncbi:hypothetical protein PDE_05595 [Penicillium oxalicum 114-2]|uniref:N-alpha-acetyltransferase 40 n=1 Tax=Penicillium oxalicum (strain 114-2 / CGMCC 5302) TaxID=933388 RepID=S8AWI2_PENO1|nr:hypothetical protein PDE_05595 [Penicillium oxalicum 114-2]
MPVTKQGRVTKSKKPQRASGSPSNITKSLPLVERTNALAIEQFISQYVSPPEERKPSSDGPESTVTENSLANETDVHMDVYSTATLSKEDLEACLDLVESTSREDYSASSTGWSRSKKRREMRLPEMKYLILRRRPELPGSSSLQPSRESSNEVQVVKEGTRDKRRILGFLSCMVTYEDGKKVMYCYEIHLAAEARGRGLGALLMQRMEEIGRRIGLEKSMLTVFRSNTTARKFYEKGGYEVDEYSPEPRRLRNGTVKESDYLILSKPLTP